MASAFEVAGNMIADGARAEFGFAATDISAIKPDLASGIKASLGQSFGFDHAPGMKFDI